MDFKALNSYLTSLLNLWYINQKIIITFDFRSLLIRSLPVIHSMLRKLILRRHSSIPFLRYQSSYPKVDTNNDSIHVVSNSSFGEVTSLPNTDELLRRVVREHQSKDRKFFLPWGDDEAMDEVILLFIFLWLWLSTYYMGYCISIVLELYNSKFSKIWR